MVWIYTIGIAIFNVIIRLASLFNQKAKLFIEGRKTVFKEIEEKVNPLDHPVWFHFASLGEFEQGRPVLEKLKATYSGIKIVVTFFSPSGYEVRKNYRGADGIFYLPLDTRSNTKKFIELINPRMAIFTKYEFWFYYFRTLNQHRIPLYLISGIFRPSQAFFKWYGGFNRRMLSYVTHFFVQNDESVRLLNEIGITKVSLSGDTRFDRVFENANSPKQIAEVEQFCGAAPVFIAGSTWLSDEKILTSFTEHYPDWKLIIAPHEIDEEHIKEIEELFPSALRFSNLKSKRSSFDAKMLIIDNIGMLSSLYQYAQVAYIGGGFGAGIHNTLEAAAFGLPLIFGPKYDKFQEAKDLISAGSATSIANMAEFLSAFEFYKANEKAALVSKKYVEENQGATQMISEIILPSLLKPQ